MDTSIIENVIQNPDFDYCEWYYDEVLYLTLKDYPRSGLAAVKMAYSFSKVDLVLEREINNLVLEAYEQLVDDAELRNSLSHDEIRFLIGRYDKLLPLDWPCTERIKFVSMLSPQKLTTGREI